MQNKHKPLAYVLEQTVGDVCQYLRQVDVSDYTQPIEILSDSTLGQHTRHFIEFFMCLKHQASKDILCVDYSARERNKTIETNPDYARTILQTMTEQILAETERWDQRLISRHDSEYPDDLVESSYGREILYCIEHCIHHLAIIKVGIKSLKLNIDLPDHFGVAPSTMKFREKSCAQ